MRAQLVPLGGRRDVLLQRLVVTGFLESLEELRDLLVGRVWWHEHRDRIEVRKDCHGAGGDRKSTRLNSSHLVISYAVFCLKKKNQLFDLLPLGSIPDQTVTHSFNISQTVL